MRNVIGRLSPVTRRREQHAGDHPTLQYAPSSGVLPPSVGLPSTAANATEPQRDSLPAATPDGTTRDQPDGGAPSIPSTASEAERDNPPARAQHHDSGATKSSADDDGTIVKVRRYAASLLLPHLEARSGIILSMHDYRLLKSTIISTPFKGPAMVFNDDAISILKSRLFQETSHFEIKQYATEALRDALARGMTLDGYHEAKQSIKFTACRLGWKGSHRKLADQDIGILSLYICELMMQAQGKTIAGKISTLEVASMEFQPDEWINEPYSCLRTAACYLTIRVLAERDGASVKDGARALEYFPKRCAAAPPTSWKGKLQHHFGGRILWSPPTSGELVSGRTCTKVPYFVNAALSTFTGRMALTTLILFSTSTICAAAFALLEGPERYVYIGMSCSMATIMLIVLFWKSLYDIELFYMLSCDEDDKRSETYIGSLRVLWSAVEQSRMLRFALVFIIFETLALWSIFITSYVDAPSIAAAGTQSTAAASAAAASATTPGNSLSAALNASDSVSTRALAATVTRVTTMTGVLEVVFAGASATTTTAPTAFSTLVVTDTTAEATKDTSVVKAVWFRLRIGICVVYSICSLLFVLVTRMKKRSPCEVIDAA